MSKINTFLDENPDKLFDDDFLLETLGCYPYAEDIFGTNGKKDDADESHEKEPSQTTSSSSVLEPLSTASISQGKLPSASGPFSAEEAPTQSCTGDKSTSTGALEDDFAGHFQSTHILNPDELDDMMFPDDIFWNPATAYNYTGLLGFNSPNKNAFEYNYEFPEDDSDDSEESEESSSDSYESSSDSYSSDETSTSPDMEVETIEISSGLAEELSTQQVPNRNDSTEVIEVRAPSIQDGGLYKIGYSAGHSNHLQWDGIQNDFTNKEEIERHAKHAKWTRMRHRRQRDTGKSTTDMELADISELADITDESDESDGSDSTSIDILDINAPGQKITDALNKMTTVLQEEKEENVNKSDDKEKLKSRTHKDATKNKKATTTTGRKRGRKRKTNAESHKEGDRAKKVLEEMEERKAAKTPTTRSRKGSGKKAEAKGPRGRRLSTVVAEANAASEKTRNKAKMEYTYVKPCVYTNAAEHAAIEVGPYDKKAYEEYASKLSSDVKVSARFVSQGYFMSKGESNAEAPLAVVESHACNISRSIFVYPPRTHQSLELQRPEKPIEDKFPVIKPAAVRGGAADADYLLASALIVRRLRSNRIVLHKIARNEERRGAEWAVRDFGGGATGFTFKTRVADIKWLTPRVLAVANGDAVKAVSVASAKPLPSVTAQRALLHETECEWASRNDTPERFPGGNAIRELDSKRSAPGLIFTGTESGSAMLYDVASKHPLQQLHPSPAGSPTSSPVSSVRGNGLPEFVYSFTTDSGRLCLCDRRMAWDRPAFSADANALVGDTFSSLWTHDWNPAAPGEVVLGYASRAVGSMAGLDIRFPACILHARDYRSSVLPFDVHFADNCSRSEAGDFAAAASTDWKDSTYALFGERNFGIGNLHSNFDWFTPASEKEFNADQVCVMGCFLERDTLLTVSDNADVKIWSLLKL